MADTMAASESRFAEAAMAPLHQLTGHAASARRFAAALGGLPAFGAAERRGDAMWFRTGPSQVLLLGVAPPALTPDVGSIVDLTGARARFLVEGTSALAILSQGIALDLDPRSFPVHAFALTGLHHTPVLLWRPDTAVYELWALRSFARSVRDWLEDAAAGL